jgi:hypothetical protein
VRAKALLAAAGYPNGFAVTLDCVNVAWRENVCQAAAAMLTALEPVRATFEASLFVVQPGRRPDQPVALGRAQKVRHLCDERPKAQYACLWPVSVPRVVGGDGARRPQKLWRQLNRDVLLLASRELQLDLLVACAVRIA